MAKGRPRVPQSILEMRGSRRAKTREEPAHEDGEIKLPSWIGDYGREAWEYLYPKLRKIDGLLKPAYMHDFALFCEAFNEMREAMDEITRDGPTCVSKKGGMYQHPAVGMKNKAIARMLKISVRFGLNPSDCSKVLGGGSGKETKDFDPIKAILEGSKN